MSNCPTGRPVYVADHIRRHVDDNTVCGVHPGIHTREEFDAQTRREFDEEALQIEGVKLADDVGVFIRGDLTWDDLEHLGLIARDRKHYSR